MTTIEWTDRTWNPVTGCTKVSPGCDHCYAERLAVGRHRRFYPDGFGKITFHIERLEEPLHWRTPQKVFVCSMSDLFHPRINFDAILKIFEVMASAPHHTFQVLTKRPGRMAYFANDVLPQFGEAAFRWPDNVWAGTSVESAKYLPRLSLLEKVPAKVTFVSAEPLLGPLDLSRWLSYEGWARRHYTKTGHLPIAWRESFQYGHCTICGATATALSWVIVGGESGPGARPMNPAWVRGILDQCQWGEVPFFFKQWGEWSHESQVFGPGAAELVVPQQLDELSKRQGYEWEDGSWSYRVRKKAAGRLLQGREWSEFPASLQVEAKA